MYSEKLENLIKGALADGKLEERELKVLRRKAEEEGVDPDELQMDIEARLAEINEDANYPRKVEYAGVQRLCPYCNRPVPAGEAVCPHCHKALSGQEVVSSMKEFSEHMRKSPSRSYILNFPVPNNKEDLFEFTVGMYSGLKSRKYKTEYLVKLNECRKKLELLFDDDPKVNTLLEKTKPSGLDTFTMLDGLSRWWSSLPKEGKILILWLTLLFIFTALGITCHYLGI